MTNHPDELVQAVARGIDPTAWAPIQDDCPPEVRAMRQEWQRQALRVATAALDARDAWMAANAPFDGGTVTNSRLRKLRKEAARPGAKSDEERTA